MSRISSINDQFRDFNKIFIPVLLTSFIAFLLFFKTRFSRTGVLLSKFPGGPTLPLIGNASQFLIGSVDGAVKRIESYLNKYGRCCRAWIFHTPILLVADHAVLEKILAPSDHLVKPDYYDIVKMYLGDGLVSSPVTKWKRDRKQLNAGMNYKMFDGFLDTFNKYSQILVDKCNEQLVQNPTPQDIFHYFGECTLGIVCEAALGKREDADCELDNPHVLKALSVGIYSITLRVIRPYLSLPGMWNIFGNGKADAKYVDPLRNSAISYIQKKKAEQKLQFAQKMCTSDSNPRTIMDILLDPENPRDATDIYNHLVTMLGGGTDTTASAINYTMYLLALNPDHQRKVQDELDQVFENRYEDSVTFDDLSKLKYLEMCIKESMRVYPPIPLMARVVQKDVPLSDNLVIPKGCTIAIFMYELHRDPNIFPDPESFIPERFSIKFSPYAYLPFSAGIRNCIGQKYAMMEMKVILSHLLRKFTVSTSKPQKDLKVRYGIVLEPIDGIPLSLKPRPLSQ